VSHDDFEPMNGLPGVVPAGEQILWQGVPRWQTLARHAFHVDKAFVYFGALLVLDGVRELSSGSSVVVALQALYIPTVLALAALATLTLLAYACLLVVAAAASLYVRVPPRAADAVRQPWLEDIRSGLYARWRIPLERYWTLAVFITLVAFMPLVTTLLPVKLHALGLSAAWLGGCEAAISAGMLLGSLWFTHVVLRRFSRYQARTIAMLVCGVLMLVVALSDNPWLILACFAVMGLMFALNQLIGQTHRTLAVPENYRARFSAINVMLVKIGSMLGPALAGALLHVLPLEQVYLIFALLHLATVVPMLLLPGMKAFLALDHDEVKDWYWRRHPEAFRDLTAAPPASKAACEAR
jgi:hypothetical protein